VPVFGNGVPVCGDGIPMTGNDVTVRRNDIPSGGNGVLMRGNDIPVGGSGVPRRGILLLSDGNLLLHEVGGLRKIGASSHDLNLFSQRSSHQW
jgi:hypothetical protein